MSHFAERRHYCNIFPHHLESAVFKAHNNIQLDQVFGTAGVLSDETGGAGVQNKMNEQARLASFK